MSYFTFLMSTMRKRAGECGADLAGSNDADGHW
jgi:hypothetical protein